MTTRDKGLPSALTVWGLEAITVGVALWMIVSAGIAWADDSPTTLVGVWLLVFWIGFVPAVGLATLTGALVAILARRLPSSQDRRQHVRTVRLLIPAVLAAISTVFVLSAAAAGGDGVRWWPAVALISLAMGIPATLVGWWRAPSVVNKYWPDAGGLFPPERGQDPSGWRRAAGSG